MSSSEYGLRIALDQPSRLQLWLGSTISPASRRRGTDGADLRHLLCIDLDLEQRRLRDPSARRSPSSSGMRIPMVMARWRAAPVRARRAAWATLLPGRARFQVPKARNRLRCARRPRQEAASAILGGLPPPRSAGTAALDLLPSVVPDALAIARIGHAFALPFQLPRADRDRDHDRPPSSLRAKCGRFLVSAPAIAAGREGSVHSPDSSMIALAARKRLRWVQAQHPEIVASICRQSARASCVSIWDGVESIHRPGGHPGLVRLGQLGELASRHSLKLGSARPGSPRAYGRGSDRGTARSPRACAPWSRPSRDAGDRLGWKSEPWPSIEVPAAIGARRASTLGCARAEVGDHARRSAGRRRR